MKKKYGIIILSTLILIVSLTLLIGKPSYAVSSGVNPTNYCPEQIIINKGDSQEIVPGISLSLLSATSSTGEPLNNMVLSEDIFNTSLGTTIEKMDEMLLPISKLSDNPMENNYYSQLLLWWTWDIDFGGDYYLTKEEKEAIASSEKGKIVAKKIEEYQKAIDADSNTQPTLDTIDMSNITYHVTNDYIETSLITPDCTNDYAFVFTDYTVKANSPVIVVDEKGEQRTEFSKGEGFKLRIPISKINNNQINFSASITGEENFNYWGVYKGKKIAARVESNNNPGISTQEAEIPSEYFFIDCGEKETLETFESQQITNSIEVGTLNIKVIDAETKEDLSDAEIVIIDSKGNEVYRYRTTSDTLTVTLPVGDYTIKQTVTPPNYEAKTIEQRISVTSTGTNEVVLENIQLVAVPDTLKTTTTITIMGTIIVLLGIAIILYGKSKKAKN